jgi:hypothetical protein
VIQRPSWAASARRAAADRVEEHPDAQRKDALGNPEHEPGEGAGDVALAPQLLFQVRADSPHQAQAFRKRNCRRVPLMDLAALLITHGDAVCAARVLPAQTLTATRSAAA